MGKTLIRAFWCLLLAGALAWLAILVWPGHPVTAWLTTRLVIAQAVAFPTLLAVAGAGVLIVSLLVALRRATSGATRALAGLTAVACAVSSLLAVTDPYGAARYHARGVPAIGCVNMQAYRVTTYNALDTLTDQGLARLLADQPDFLVLPEVSPDTPALAGGVPGYQVFASASQKPHIAPTLTLVSDRLGSYTAQEVPMTFGALMLAPENDDSGHPSLLAVHTAPPVPSYMQQWRDDLATIDRLARDENRPDLIAGDFNATLLHGGLASYAGVGSYLGADAALATHRIEGTWPVGGVLGMKAPIDHIMVMQGPPAGGEEVTYQQVGNSDHLAVSAAVDLCS
ncbi:endonuclease/exonuclease/phosphatase family protein [Rothia nasimurium]|uniref:endonuclease/exonuclease/phosphatase family protein n=1 Tax=Rothia nasimurium TaxID=85336 RepID=UPI001F3AE43B|nr:endonuclease/exonuclease/phosphatase family protein [Rothia nasimurium]